MIPTTKDDRIHIYCIGTDPVWFATTTDIDMFRDAIDTDDYREGSESTLESKVT